MIAVLVGLPLAADWPVTEKLDLDAVYRIKDEGLQRSKVMEIESYLTDVYGPRLTGSPNIKEAADWAQKTMKEWGLANVHLETWPFGRGWQNQRFVGDGGHAARVSADRAIPKAWTPGTNGPVTGEAVHRGHQRGARTSTRSRGKLRGKFVLDDGDARRRRRISRRPAIATPTPSWPISRSSRRGRRAAAADAAAAAARRTSSASGRSSSIDEGVAALLDLSRGDGGTFFVQARRAFARSEGAAAAAAGRRSPSSTTAESSRTLREEDPGHAADGHRQHVLRRRSQRVQHRRRDCRAPTRPTRS